MMDSQTDQEKLHSFSVSGAVPVILGEKMYWIAEPTYSPTAQTRNLVTYRMDVSGRYQKISAVSVSVKDGKFELLVLSLKSRATAEAVVIKFLLNN